MFLHSSKRSKRGSVKLESKKQEVVLDSLEPKSEAIIEPKEEISKEVIADKKPLDLEIKKKRKEKGKD